MDPDVKTLKEIFKVLKNEKKGFVSFVIGRLAEFSETNPELSKLTRLKMDQQLNKKKIVILITLKYIERNPNKPNDPSKNTFKTCILKKLNSKTYFEPVFFYARNFFYCWCCCRFKKYV